jgi:hypothetical protein
MCSRFDDWIYRHFFTITVDYNSSRIELLLNDASDESLTNLGLISHSPFISPVLWITTTTLISLDSSLNSGRRVRVRITLRLAVYRQSVRLGAEPLEAHGQIFFS